MGGVGRPARQVAGLPRPAGREEGSALGCVLQRRHSHGGEKGGRLGGQTTRGQGTTRMVLAEGAGTPLGVQVEKAPPAEGKRLEPTRRGGRLGGRRAKRRRPRRRIAARGDESNAARAWLGKRDIAPMMPARRHHRQATHQDGRQLRRYRPRGLSARTNSGRQSFRRLVVRDERSAPVLTALVHRPCALSTLKKVWG
jgi:hypothetical protein